MSRIRSIHPGFFTDDQLFSISFAARLLFLGLGVEADDKGVFEWKPLTLKARLFPADNLDIVPLMEELEAANAIKSYEIDGRYYGAIRNFRKFQRPKCPNDVFPAPIHIRIYIGLVKPKAETQGDNEDLFPPKGEIPIQMEDGGDKMEDEGGRMDGRKSRAREIPDDWQPSEFGPDTISRGIVDSWDTKHLALQRERFTSHHRKKSSKFTDWQAAWSTWVLNSENFGGTNGRSQANRGGSSHARFDNRDGVARALDRRLGLDEPSG